MALGTATGGWRIIKTLGHKLVKLHPIQASRRRTSSATVLSLAGALRHAGIDYAQHFDRDHGRGLRQESKGPAHGPSWSASSGPGCSRCPPRRLMAFLLVRLAMGMGWIS
jgi:hypothetical protein